MIAHRLRNSDASHRRDTFQSRRDIDAIAEDVSILNNHVPDVHAHTELNAALLRHTGVTGTHSTLNVGRTGHCVHDTGELNQDRVASEFHDAALMFRHLGIDEIGS